MSSKNIKGFQWKRIIFFFLGLLFMVALIPEIANAAMSGNGTVEAPFTADKMPAIKIFQCNAQGEKISGELGGDLNGDDLIDANDIKSEGDITLPIGCKEKIYLLVEYENGETVKAGQYVFNSASQKNIEISNYTVKAARNIKINGKKITRPLPANYSLGIRCV